MTAFLGVTPAISRADPGVNVTCTASPAAGVVVEGEIALFVGVVTCDDRLGMSHEFPVQYAAAFATPYPAQGL